MGDIPHLAWRPEPRRAFALLDIVQYSIGRDLVTINPAKSEIVNTANRLECPKVRRSRVITMK
jgi:hypothetical protein